MTSIDLVIFTDRSGKIFISQTPFFGAPKWPFSQTPPKNGHFEKFWKFRIFAKKVAIFGDFFKNDLHWPGPDSFLAPLEPQKWPKSDFCQKNLMIFWQNWRFCPKTFISKTFRVLRNFAKFFGKILPFFSSTLSNDILPQKAKYPKGPV